MKSTWVPGADETGFGICNLPMGVVRSTGRPGSPAARIGDSALDLRVLADAGLLDVPAGTFDEPTLNRFLALGRGAWSAVRSRLQELLSVGSQEVMRTSAALVALDEVDVLMPVTIGDYIDFYASLEHATNLGRMFRPDAEPLLANWRHLPVGYHGRSGTVVVSGTSIRRPLGQRAPERPGAPPTFGPERRLDIEIELGFVTGSGPSPGRPIPTGAARDHIFGCVLVNDWSAREIQRWEYQPLGPFLGKSFATSISPWIVPLEALEPWLITGPEQVPVPLDYLRCDEPWALDVQLEAELNGTVISQTSAAGVYWNVAQQLAHATVNGASVAAGDLFASGTISGSSPDSYGSLIELTWAGSKPISLKDGAKRTFLQDGDEVTIRGRAGAVSLGEVRGQIVAA